MGTIWSGYWSLHDLVLQQIHNLSATAEPDTTSQEGKRLFKWQIYKALAKGWGACFPKLLKCPVKRAEREEVLLWKMVSLRGANESPSRKGKKRKENGWLSEVIWFSTKCSILKMSRQNIKKRKGEKDHRDDSWYLNTGGDAEDFTSLLCRLRSLLAAYAAFWRSHLSACARSNAFISHFYPTAQNLVPALALPSADQAAELQHHSHFSSQGGDRHQDAGSIPCTEPSLHIKQPIPVLISPQTLKKINVGSPLKANPRAVRAARLIYWLQFTRT